MMRQPAESIGENAYCALLEEVYTTPKPGLVDLCSNGAHKDMDVGTFERSARALRPFFTAMADQGFERGCSPEELFGEIRKTGMEAEKAMYRATGGVNTHKGLIFTLGIFCAAAGRCMREAGKADPAGIIDMQQKMTHRILSGELARMKSEGSLSHGEKNFQKYGTSGIRGEAILGYPSVMNLALPVMMEGLKEGRQWNQIKLQTLLALMSSMEDSNIIARHDPSVLEQVHREAKAFLEMGGAYRREAFEELIAMDQDYIRRNISPGGCADLLAAAVFMILTGR
ncbi:MAG: triphosphoribosyl-dephospho-CoA synthase CitG [Enterocloster sp.]